MAVKKAKGISFEEGMERLETIAQQMEQSGQPLDELLKLYEEGMKLSQELTQKLDAMDGRMQEVHAGKNGEMVLSASDVVEPENLADVE